MALLFNTIGRGWLPAICVAAALGIAPWRPGRAEGLSGEDWPMEVVVLSGGKSYRGLIESADRDDPWVHFVQIVRCEGRPMHLVIRTFERSSIERLERLETPRRAVLRQRIEQFLNRATIEAGRMDAVVLRIVQREGGRRWTYYGRWFRLESTADETSTRRIIVRMEQVFTAYRQLLPPRREHTGPAVRPLVIVVFGSMDEYREHLRRLGVMIPNPACFLPEANQVVAGTRLKQFSAELARVRAKHAQLEKELKQLRAELPKELAAQARQMEADGLTPAQIRQALLARRRRFEEAIGRKEQELKAAERENAGLFADFTDELFVRLFHEAFHAYLENYVFPAGQYDVPIWLNEGLAQIFEAGLLEYDSLRIDAPNRRALECLREDLRSEQPLPLGRLLEAEPRDFLADEQSARYYAYAWAVAYYLGFDQRVLTGERLDTYVRAEAAKLPPVARFERLVDMPLGQFEAAWRRYVQELK